MDENSKSDGDKKSDKIAESYTSPKRAFWSEIDYLTKGLGLCGILAFLSSVCYDFGYFWALGLSFSDAPTSVSDHVRSGLDWIPFNIAAFGLAAIIIVTLKPFYKNFEDTKEDAEITKKRMNDFNSFVQKFFKWAFPLTGASTVILYILLGDSMPNSLVGISLLLGIYTVILNIVNRKGFFRLSAQMFIMIILLPTVFLYAFSEGYRDAKRSIMHPTKIVTTVNHTECINLQLIRMFEKGALVAVDGEQKIAFVGWDKISIIKLQDIPKPFAGMLCPWFGLRCPSKSAQ